MNEKKDDKFESSLNVILGFILVGGIIAGAFFWLRTIQKDNWSVIIDDGNNLRSSGNYSNLDECLASLQSLRLNNNYISIECGSNCKYSDTAVGAYRCDKTYD